MHIGLNGQKLLTNQPAGPEVFTYNLYNSLAKIDTTNKYTVYFEVEPNKDFWSKLTAGNSNFVYKVLPKVFSWTQISLAFELLKNPVDIFFSPFHTLPGLTTLLSFGKFKPIIFIHGLEYKSNNEYKNKPFHKLVHPFVLWWVCTTAKQIVVPSHSTAQSIVNAGFWFFDKTKIKIVTEGVSDIYYKRSEEEIDKVRIKYGLLNTKYLIFISTIQPRKNLPTLVQGLGIAVHQHPALKNLKLVVCGKNGWEYQESLEAPKKYNIEQNVVFAGRTPDEDSPALISGAEAFVSTSYEEGFGLPLLEAMACEIPSIVSKISAFEEVGQDTPYYIDPSEEKLIADTISKVTMEPRDHSRIEKAKNIAAKYTWESTAKSVLEIFKRF